MERSRDYSGDSATNDRTKVRRQTYVALSIALVAKSLDGDVGTQTKEEENKNCRNYVKKCDQRDRSSNCGGDPHIPRNRPKHGARLGKAPLRGPVSLIGSNRLTSVGFQADLAERMHQSHRHKAEKFSLLTRSAYVRLRPISRNWKIG